MARSRSEDIDVLSLSFTDVLTCVLGASVALFLIFVAIVKLTSTESTATGNQTGSWAKKARSIQKEMDQGFATASLRMVTDQKELLDQITTGNLPDSVDKRDIVTRKGRDVYYGRFYHFSVGLSDATHFFIEPTRLSGELSLQLIVGGLPRFCQIKIEPNLLAGKRYLFSLNQAYDFYLQFNGSIAACKGVLN